MILPRKGLIALGSIIGSSDCLTIVKIADGTLILHIDCVLSLGSLNGLEINGHKFAIYIESSDVFIDFIDQSVCLLDLLMY